ncbi:hypothetical protein HUU05_29415, partial [candidate division KSB1 bacterium]|nr:hypothetical protein [candidate division KSB1 bacterium]
MLDDFSFQRSCGGSSPSREWMPSSFLATFVLAFRTRLASSVISSQQKALAAAVQVPRLKVISYKLINAVLRSRKLILIIFLTSTGLLTAVMVFWEMRGTIWTPWDHHTLELSLMGLSILVASVMSLMAVVFYLRKPDWTTFFKTRFPGIYRLLSNKFYVDEIYQGLIVNPVYAISKYFLWKGSDQKLIDGLMVHGWSSVSGVVARIVSALQTGSLGHYLLFLWLGLIVFLM